MNPNVKRLFAHIRESLTWAQFKESWPRQAVFWLAYLPSLWFFGNPFVAAAVAFAVLYAAERVHARYAKALVARIEATDGPVWDVAVNQVKVGTITDADYATIRLRVFCDVRVYVGQVMNLLRVALNSFDYCYRAIPIGLFWVGVALAVFSPETISSVISTLQGATPNDIKHAVSMAGSMLALMMMLSVAFHWAFGLSRFGFINRFDEAIGTAVRKHCGVVADGVIVLSRWTNGKLAVIDEMAIFRRAAKT